MRDFPRFIKIGEDRINIDEIVSYGIGAEWGDGDGDDDIRYLYVETKTSEELFQYEEDDEIDFDIDEKLAELDDLFLIKN